MTKILLLEDIRSDIDLIERELKKSGTEYILKVTDNEKEYIHLLIDFKPDIILADYNLPSFNGLEAFRIMNDNKPETPFILVSGTIGEEKAVEVMKTGINDYILKDRLQRLNIAIKKEIEDTIIRRLHFIAREALLESEENYKSIFEQSHDPIFIHSYEGDIVNINDKASALLQLSKEKLLCANILDLHPEEEKEKVKSQLEKTKNEGYTKYESRLIDEEGKEIIIEVSSSKAYKDQSLIQSIVRDITEKKKAEEELIKAKEKAEQSDKLKSAFLASLSHEIRTPMNSMMGFSKLLLKPDLPDEKRNIYSEAIQKSGKHLIKIIDDLIEISKIEANIVEIENEEFNINSLFDDLHLQFKSSPPKGKINIILDVHKPLKDKDAIIVSDEAKIRQILINFITNAYKFTLEGRIDIGYRVSDDNQSIIFFVNDTGIGFPESAKDIIFERFSQYSIGDKREFEGTGLGLAISKGLAESLNGEINCRSKEGKGSEFFFSIPKSEIQTQSILEESEEENMDYDWTGKTIMIAEDEELNYLFLEELMSEYNAKIIHAENGIIALELFQKEVIDLILMDIKMPEMDGMEATKKIRLIDQKIPIIMQTAFASSVDKKSSFDMGCSDFYTKPINPEKIVQMINKHLFPKKLKTTK